MLASDYRERAWAALRGKWGTMALITLIYMIIVSTCSVIPAVGQTASLLITGPFALSLATLSLTVLRGGEIKVEMLFDGFRNFVSAFLLQLVNSLLVMLWSLLFVIPGIVKAYSYAMSTYILADNPEMSQAECRKESMRMMQGHKWRLFCLQFSFLGWSILCALTFGILSFWVAPYMNTATAAFYEDLKAHRTVCLTDGESI